MSKISRVLLMAALCFLSVAAQDTVFADNVLQVDGFGNEEIKESNLIAKCYDEETKTAYKIDAVWYPPGKCEKRVCSRKNNSKTPIIKTMECEPCTTCKLSSQMCQSFKPEKHYPKCCQQCMTKAVILKKTENKKYKNI